MKKNKLFATMGILSSLLLGSQMVLAATADSCPTLDSIKKLTITNVIKSSGENRYNVYSDYQYVGGYTSTGEYKYTAFVFMVNGVKADNAGKAVQKVEDALTKATGKPTVQAGDYDFECVYPLDFSKDGADYHNAFPVAKAEVYGTDFNSLKPKTK